VIELRRARSSRPSPWTVLVTRGGDITASDIAWCAQVDRARREQWASAGRLKRDPPFTEHDAMEAAIAFSLAREGVSQKAATTAWEAVRGDVQRLLIAGEREIWVVVSAAGRRAWALASAATAAQRAVGEGPCWTVATAAATEQACIRYAELVTRPGAAGGRVTRLQRSHRSVRSARLK
jgi:hypothetical protein